MQDMRRRKAKQPISATVPAKYQRKLYAEAKKRGISASALLCMILAERYGEAD